MRMPAGFGASQGGSVGAVPRVAPSKSRPVLVDQAASGSSQGSEDDGAMESPRVQLARPCHTVAAAGGPKGLGVNHSS